jgi:hypothetical protein
MQCIRRQRIRDRNISAVGEVEGCRYPYWPRSPVASGFSDQARLKDYEDIIRSAGLRSLAKIEFKPPPPGERGMKDHMTTSERKQPPVVYSIDHPKKRIQLLRTKA